MTTKKQGTLQSIINRKIVWALLAIVVVVAVLWFGPTQLFGSNVTTSYQAVFLTNEQVYFGKLSTDGRWLVLKDVYYLQTAGQLQQASTGEQSNLQLVKLGSELHGPQDTMYLERDNVLYWENMKEDSQVVKAIVKHKGTQ